jgi:hypothetical protein
MKKKFALYALPVFIAVAILGVGLVSAHDADEEGYILGWAKHIRGDKPNHEEMMGQKAENLGITVEEFETQMTEKKEAMLQKKADMLGIDLVVLQEWMETAKEEGSETWERFLKDNGINSESLWAHKIEEKLNQLVGEGELTASEAEEKLDLMQEKFENGGGHKHFKRGWFHREKPLE